ncbi:unnamed protein product, partial [Linum tenue]
PEHLSPSASWSLPRTDPRGCRDGGRKPSVSGDDDEGDFLHGPDFGQRGVDVFGLELLVDVVEDLDEGLGEGAAVDDGLLGAADFGGGDELHGLGDLLGILDGFDSGSELAEVALNRGNRGGSGGGRRGRIGRWDLERRDGGAEGER